MAGSTQWNALLGSAGTAALIAIAAPASAAEEAQDYDLPAQPLGDALRAVALAARQSVIVPSTLVEGKTAPALKGRLTAQAAVALLLKGSGLAAHRSGASLVVADAADDEAGRAAPSSGDIVVTGTRIRGAPVASPVIALGERQIRNTGQATLGEVARSLPQSFGGGQNPGIGYNVPGTSGVDVGGGASINLRGLGSDATLTLLDGHRLSYSSSRQSIDVSAIPLVALDRIEIVPDGASALYGSDAVAGVANILLKHDYGGLEARARLGSSTDGGDFQQQYDLVTGTRWSSGGLVVSYEFNRSTAIESRDRSYARDRSPGLTLYPFLKSHSAVVSGHQALTDGLTFEIDGLYNKRWEDSTFPLDPSGDLKAARGTAPSVATSYAIAPTLKLALGGDWRAALTGSYAQDRVRFFVNTYEGDALTFSGGGCYCNTERSAELSTDGPLFALPGGPAKVALGGGFRRNGFNSDRGAGDPANISRSQTSYYGYGELSLPLVGPEQGLAAIYRLNASAAVRYERYPGIGHVATPKLGLIYAPSPAVDLKASWGKSFRAPTLREQYQLRSALLLPADYFGDENQPATATILYADGGNRALKSERATSWSATVALHPPALPGARLEISYFSTRYTNRIVTPISALTQALTNPIYSAQVTRDPSAAAQDAIIADASSFVNATGAPYDPASVVALIDNSNVNAGRQKIRGVDALLDYKATLGGSDSLTLAINGAYLHSNQQLSPTQPTTALAGTLFHPPHVRARGWASWQAGDLTLTPVVSYTGSVRDTLSAARRRVSSMTTFDMTAVYRPSAESGWAKGFELNLSVQNLFNDKPDTIPTVTYTDTPYDSTNASPVGRFISVGIAKKW